jgi:outer membrane protein assembly factor BamB
MATRQKILIGGLLTTLGLLLLIFVVLLLNIGGTPTRETPSAQTGTMTATSATKVAGTAKPVQAALPTALYFTTNGGNLDALSGKDGSLLWNRSFKSSAGDGYFSSSITLANGLLYHYFGNDHTLSAINAQTGTTVWTFDRGPVSAFGVIEGTVAFNAVFVTKGTCAFPRCAPNQDSVYRLDPLHGTAQWHISGMSLVAVDATHLYVQNINKLEAIDPQTGNVVWTFTDTKLLDNVLVISNTVYLTDADPENLNHRVLGLDAGTGQQRWVDAEPSSQPYLLGALQNGALVALDGAKPQEALFDSATGKTLWTLPGGRTSVVQGHIFFQPTSSPQIEQIDPVTGTATWTYATQNHLVDWSADGKMLYLLPGGTAETLAQVTIGAQHANWSVPVSGALWLGSLGEDAFTATGDFISFGTAATVLSTMAGPIPQGPFTTYLLRSSDGKTVWAHQTGSVIDAGAIINIGANP